MTNETKFTPTADMRLAAIEIIETKVPSQLGGETHRNYAGRIVAALHAAGMLQTAADQAAPDLVTACARALAFVESMPDADNVGLADHLRAAIRRATGEDR